MNCSVIQETARVDKSEWRSANIDANREIVFAVGDVHGCADLLDAEIWMASRSSSTKACER
jgi:hypothetical protein